MRKWSQPAQRNRYGQPAPPAWTLGFGAGAEQDGDLADRTARVFEVRQLLGGSPDAVAAPVELQAVTGSMASPTVNFFRAKLT